MSTPSATAPAGQVHTATPWARTGLVVHREHSHAAAVIADCNYAGGTYNMNMTNAAHIVRCVNTHSQLLAQNAALKAALENVLGFCATNQGMEAQMAMDDARAALGVSP